MDEASETHKIKQCPVLQRLGLEAKSSHRKMPNIDITNLDGHSIASGGMAEDSVIKGIISECGVTT